MSVASLIKELDSAGTLPAGFGDLLRTVPRELFVPDRVWIEHRGQSVPVDRQAEPDRWLSAVYSTDPIVTQWDDGLTEWPKVGSTATCSASAPAVVGAMLSALDVQPGQSVLEIGTGTGFNAALLAETVGEAGHVSTVEVDSSVMACANEHLEDAGYRTVRTLTGDGERGDPAYAPFDRIISTAAVQMGHLPYAWVEQTRPGGVVVAPMRGAFSSGPLVRFEVGDDGTATGHAQPMGVGFMELRGQRTPSSAGIECAEELGDTRATDIDPIQVLDDPHARWALTVGLPSCRYFIEHHNGGDARAWLKDPLSGSWAVILSDGTAGTVRQFGPRRLWDEAESVIRWWLVNGKPARSDWTWTVTPERQSVTLPR